MLPLCRVNEEYQVITDHAENFPQNTAALMEMIDYMKIAEEVTLKKQIIKLRDTLNSLLFLSDYWILTEQEMAMNNSAFQWYHRMPEIVENSKIMIENKTQEFQDALRGK